jgi:FkbM family methyltransferase
MSTALRKLRKLTALLADDRYRRALRHGVAAAVEHSSLLRSLRCATVLDVGANVGQFSLVTRVCMPDARIIAFEPLAAPASLFRTVFADDPQVTLHQVAIGPEPGRVAMHVSSRIDSSSLLPITHRQTSMFPGTGQCRTERVCVDRLSALIDLAAIQMPALLKIDVQGFELQALQGCASSLDRIEYVYVECSFLELYEGQALVADVVLYLRERGFALRGVHNMTYDAAGRSVQADFFFARPGSGGA